MSAYAALEQKFREMALLGQVEAILHWDAATMLQPGSQPVRGEQLAFLATQRHRMINDPKLEELLTRAESDISSLEPWQQANLREMHRAFIHETCLPESWVEAFAKAASESEFAWRDARATNDFKGFAPYLENILKVVREKAAAKADALHVGLYDALLDAYDPDMRQAVIDPLFATLKERLPGMIAIAAEKHPSLPPSDRWALPVATQQAMAVELMEMLGFPMDAGRLDISTHPFCGGVKGDIRITARYMENDFSEGIYAVLHETGHALYEAALPEAWQYQPVGQARGMSLHESQSLFVEMQLGRSRAFCEPLAKLLAKHGSRIDPDLLYQHLTSVGRSFIRVDADEVTYPTHVILRYELEKQLLSRSLSVGDLPEAWAALQQELLGIRPTTPAEGCLQDIHWPGGDFGYFPTYTLGALTAAQLMAAARKALPALDSQLEKGEFSALFQWLKANVHGKASSQTTQAIITEATGKPLDTEAFFDHITGRYLQ